MNKITLETTFSLLEKLAEYVMTEVPTRREMDQRFDRMTLQLDRLQQEKADKADVIEIKQQLNLLVTSVDKLAGEVQISRTEQKAFDAAFRRLEKRIDDLEDKHSGYRVRDKDE